MATDYDAPRKTDDDSESIEALKERVPDKTSGSIDNDDTDVTVIPEISLPRPAVMTLTPPVN